jgi:hypothetical protein
MARHYYRTNVPLGVMFIKWIGLGILVLGYMAYDACFKAPQRETQRVAQAQWDRQHFNGLRLEKQAYDTEHGLYFDKLNKETCTTVGYPGYPACPVQQYFVNGSPQAAR